MQEMPTIFGSSAASTYYDPSQMQTVLGSTGQQVFQNNLVAAPREPTRVARHVQQIVEGIKMADKPKRRLVQVFIADPNENVPTDQMLLYSGDQKLTDATDQELFFEVDINTLLKAHNEKRVKLVDKKVKERTEHLEPAKIRDLKMVVVTVAEF